MKVGSSMYFADRCLGKAICLIFSLINAIKPKAKGPVSPISTVLVIELFEMGAAAMLAPSLKYIKDRGDIRVCCLCTSMVKEGWELFGFVPKDDIYVVRMENIFAFIGSLFKQIAKLRRINFDLVIDYELFTRITAIISFIVKAKRRAGFYRYEQEGLYRGSFYDYRCAFNQNAHIAKNYFALTKLAFEGSTEYPAYKGYVDNADLVMPTYESKTDIQKKLCGVLEATCPGFGGKKIILLNPDVGPYLNVRNYPLDSFVKVVKGILEKQEDSLVILIGVHENAQTCQRLIDSVQSDRCVNFCGKTDTLFHLLELMRLAVLVISNDNGIAHFSAYAGTPCLAMFGPETPYMYGPLGKCVALYSHYHCSPCVTAYNHKRSKCQNNLCLKSINPDVVVKVALDILDGKDIRYQTVNNETEYIR